MALGTEVVLRPLRQHLLLRMAAWQMRRSGGQLGLLDRDTAADLLVHAANLQAEQAGLQVVLALLALERGRPDPARSDLDSAFAACRPGLHPDGAFAGRPLATAYRQRLRAARR